MEHPIINPPNPYVGNLRIFPGTLIKVSGRPRPNATRFAINFQTGPSINPRDDLALHLSPCFTPPRVVRNSLISGNWGLEEAWGNGTVVNPHAPFEIMVLVELEQFKIAINGAHFCEYRHRIPYQQITHLTIDGDLDIDRITVTSADAAYNRGPQPTGGYQQQHPTAPPPVSMAPSQSTPYPTGPTPGMPMPPMYPSLAPQPMAPSHYPSVPSMPAAPGPMPTPSTYASGYPPSSGPYPPPGGPQYPQAAPMGGPAPAPSGYHQGGYPQQPHPQHQPGSSTSTPFGNLPIGGKALGTIAGLGIGAAAGAAALSALKPMKKVKKLMKPHKAFKAKGWGRSSSSSSSSSNSSRGSFSSNSS